MVLLWYGYDIAAMVLHFLVNDIIGMSWQHDYDAAMVLHLYCMV